MKNVYSNREHDPVNKQPKESNSIGPVGIGTTDENNSKIANISEPSQHFTSMRRFEEGYDLHDPNYDKWHSINHLEMSSIIGTFTDIPPLAPVGRPLTTYPPTRHVQCTPLTPV